MKRFLKWLFFGSAASKSLTNEFKTPTQSDYVSRIYDINIQMAFLKNPRRYDVCNYDPSLTPEFWNGVEVRDLARIEELKQELLIVEADKLLGNIK